MRIFTVIVVLTGFFSSPLMAKEFDGVYWTTIAPDIAEGYFGIKCVGAKGHIQIREGDVEGEVISEQLVAFDVTGTIDDNGLLQGGIGLSIILVSSFEGRHQGDIGDGRWETANGCEGSWQAQRVNAGANEDNPDVDVKAMQQRFCTNKAYLNCTNQDVATCVEGFTPAMAFCETLIPRSMEAPWANTAGLAFNHCVLNKHLWESGANMREVGDCLKKALNPVELHR